MKKLKIFQPKYILFAIIIFTLVSRIFRLDYPNSYVFDEVYHGFTAKEYAKGSKVAWEWWNTPPPGVAYEWTHPPLAKEIMASSILLFRSENAWAYRLPGVLFGVLSVFLVYKLAMILFKKQSIALLASFLFSIDGLLFVQSRTAMNDIYFVTFMLLSLIFFLKKRWLLTAIFFGLALSSKWAAIYILILYLIFIIRHKQFKLVPFFFISPLIYILSYLPFFLLDHSLDQFIELQKQMWWYHTGLKATHDYASPWWSWPLNLYPIWYFVDYQGKNLANIFASGNPALFWFGAIALVLTFFDFIKTKAENLLIILLGFLIFWLPWSLSPRIMFLYHYSPTIPFLSLALAYQLNFLLNNPKNKIFFILLLVLIIESFVIIFPFLTAIPLPRELVRIFFLTNITKNPF